MDQLATAIAALRELEEDQQVPKNVKARIADTIKVLEQDAETSIKASRAMQQLEQLSEDTNVQPFTRTQIFNIVSQLEIL